MDTRAVYALLEDVVAALEVESPPERIETELGKLREMLDKEIPEKKLDRNLLIATWNIRNFGDVTMKWESQEDDKPLRDLHSLHCIAEIISRFDIVAIQEATGNLNALKHLLNLLGPHWGLILSDVTKKAPYERLAYLFDTRKVQLSGLACEIVIPEKELKKGPLKKQFARTPYAVGFRAGSAHFTLVTLHVEFGKKKDRLPELKGIAEWLAWWMRFKNKWDRNIITLGDFNIDKLDGELYKAFTSTGLVIPDELRTARRMVGTPNIFDHIAWFPKLALTYNIGGSFEFDKVALSSRKLSEKEMTSRISDHLPLWVEFLIP